MKNFYNAISPNKVWILALVAIMAACSQLEVSDPDKATLEQSADELASAFSLDPYGLENFAIIPSSPTSVGGVIPGILDPDGPGGNVSCDMIAMEYGISFGNGTTDNINYTGGGAFDNDFPEGFTIITDGTNVTWSYNKPGYCLVNAAIAVKGSNAANVYVYGSGVTGDSGLASPPNASGEPAGLSNLTICWTEEPCEDEPCFEWIGETAWSAGTRYITRGNWATWSTKSALEHGVTLFAGQTMNAGTVKLVDGVIMITLKEGWRFAETDENVKIQHYSETPLAINPNPGGFDTKGTATSSPFTIAVPNGAFYGVHVDVEEYREVECPVED